MSDRADALEQCQHRQPPSSKADDALTRLGGRILRD
jgi:hypothetical protein